MAIVWTIENAASAALTHSLLGNYAVRAFGSFDSYKRLTKIQKGTAPNVLVVDLDAAKESASRIYNVINLNYPDAVIIFLKSKDGEVPHLMGRQCMILEKPIDIFSIKSLIDSLVTKTSNNSRLVEFSNLLVDLDHSEIFIKGNDEKESLTQRELRIIRTLIDKKEQVVTREFLIEKAWNGVKVSPRTIDSQISRLRKRLFEARVSIKSVYGGGYMITAEAQ